MDRINANTATILKNATEYKDKSVLKDLIKGFNTQVKENRENKTSTRPNTTTTTSSSSSSSSGEMEIEEDE